MVLDLTQALRAPGQSFQFSFAQDWPPVVVAGERIRFEKPVKVQGSFVYTTENFLVEGQLEAEYIGTCSRCLKDVPATMIIEFREEFVKHTDEDHPDRYLYQGEKIELDTMVEDLLALNTPMRHLCNESCRGLCPVCGADRNIRECDCLGGPDGETPERTEFPN